MSQKFYNPFRIILTGGIASGKSTVAMIFKSMGVSIIDADKIAAELVQPHQTGWIKIKEHFPDKFFDQNGHLIRSKMRAEIIAKPEQKKLLESLLHPLVKMEMMNQCQRSQSPYIILDIPLFAENHQQYHKVPYHEMQSLNVEASNIINYQRCLSIITTEKIQINRVIERDQVSKFQAENMFALQANNEKRKQLADDLLYNDDTLDKLKLSVSNLHQKYIQMTKDLKIN